MKFHFLPKAKWFLDEPGCDKAIIAPLGCLFLKDTAGLHMQQAQQATVQPGQQAVHHCGVWYKLTQIPLPGTAAAVTWCLTLDAPSDRRGVDDESRVSGQRGCKAPSGQKH